MLKFWNWLVYSSKDADKISATIKGLATFIPSIVVVFGLAHLHVDPGTILSGLDAIAGFVASILAAISALVTLLAFLRKIWRTAEGTNATLNVQE